ncbi:MAG: DinB family protein [Saprospiraceae bacterium]
MTKKDIQQQLTEKHQAFIQYILDLPETDFVFAKPDKWTAGQQLEHIYRSVAPLKLALGLPKFLLRFWFGKANRPSRDYDTLVSKYQAKLADGGKAPAPFVPRPVLFVQRENLRDKLQRTVQALNRRLNAFSEQELDTYILPHPLLGKITLREMLYFTIYHVMHHQKAVQASLQV